MHPTARAGLFWMLLVAASSQAKEPVVPSKLVEVTSRIPDAVLDLRYATANNFMGKQVYPDGSRCLLLPEALDRLVKAADALRAQGYRLRLYDCYRPLSVQWELWKILPKPGYVADPRKGSHHNRGAAVDLGLSYLEGNEVEHPTPFDTFTPAAHHGYPGASPAATRHRELLREAMEAAGFRKNRMEWWHYALPGAAQYPVLDEPLVAPPASGGAGGKAAPGHAPE
jgi:D-alanyl-D-alanine dipeptidase